MLIFNKLEYMDFVYNIIEDANANAGSISVIIFILTILIGWFSGLFKFLKNKPSFKIDVIRKCTFGSIIDLRKTHEGLPVTKTAFVIYLRITNVGRYSSSVGKINLGYYKSDFSKRIFSKRIWLKETICKDDFRFDFENSEMAIALPFLKQHNLTMINCYDTYLSVGKSVSGIVYFEQENSYGSYMPRVNKGDEFSKVKIIVRDSFNRSYTKRLNIPIIDPNEALKYNPLFAQTQEEFVSKV